MIASMTPLEIVRKDKIAVGISTIVATTFAMSFADAVVKYVSSDFTVWQIYVLRSI